LTGFKVKPKKENQKWDFTELKKHSDVAIHLTNA